MLFRLRHETRYAYAAPVAHAAHLVHLRPRALPGRQRVRQAALLPDPQPSRIEHGTDAFGNDAAWVFLDAPHSAFAITLSAEIEVTSPEPPWAEATPPWRAVSEAAFSAGPAGLEAGPFLFPSPLAEPAPEARDYVARSFGDGQPVLSALLDLNARIGRDFTFRPGVTTVSTPVRQVLAQRAGVCQDFTHLMIAGLRALGLPARYVSGYVCTYAEPGHERRGADQSHAWVGCWLGPHFGWIDLDPTNGIMVRDEHVVLGWGRDYADVSPVRGVLVGGGAQALDVSVALSRA